MLGATAEEKLKGSQPTKMYNNEKARSSQEQYRNRNQKLECHKGDRLGYLARDCRSSQYTNATLDLIILPMRQTKKGKTSFLLDTGATLTLIKVGNLKGNTLMREERFALTGVTGHKIHTLGKIRATITLGDREIRHIMYVVRDDFSNKLGGDTGTRFFE
ncbi:hypothetical protein P5V15_012708 [Pogonomyrmex californicus]